MFAPLLAPIHWLDRQLCPHSWVHHKNKGHTGTNWNNYLIVPCRSNAIVDASLSDSFSVAEVVNTGRVRHKWKAFDKTWSLVRGQPSQVINKPVPLLLIASFKIVSRLSCKAKDESSGTHTAGEATTRHGLLSLYTEDPVGSQIAFVILINDRINNFFF